MKKPITKILSLNLIVRLLTIFIAVALFSGLTIWVGIDVTNKVTGNAEKLVNSHVPELRAISDLQQAMNQHHIALYNDYAEATEIDLIQYETFRSALNKSLSELSKLGLTTKEISALRQALEDFDSHTLNFNSEMKRGRDRDWDELRMHLAAAQAAKDRVDLMLLNWNDQIQSRAGEGGNMTLYEIKRLSRLQLGFILSVLIASIVILLAALSRYKAREKIYQLAYFDDLTSLPNRKHLEDNWENLTDHIVDPNSQALIFIRLDHFQLVTGTFGYSVGDQLLSSVSTWIESTLNRQHENSQLFHFAPGVWLALIISDTNPALVDNLASDLLELSKEPVKIHDRELNISCSIGIAYFTRQEYNLENLLRNADTALQTARQLGGNNARIFHEEMNLAAENRLATENGIRAAMRNSEFQLYFQPKVRSKNEQITGAEALIRWHRNGKMISPNQFIPIAEQSALIIEIGDWVLTEACNQWARWNQKGQSDLCIAVNISAQQFQMPDFPQKVQRLLEHTGMPPENLELEITEEVAAESSENIVTIMSQLKSIGVTLAIDDFGTGYSSLSHLKRFPIDTIKIDKMFVNQMETSKQDMAIVRMVHTLAKELDFKVVAEGVETDTQRQILMDLGSDQLQGYYFSEPLSTNEFINILTQDSKSAHVM